jgi:hypothetical protein
MFYDITGVLSDMNQEEFEKNEDEQKVFDSDLKELISFTKIRKHSLQYVSK